MKSIKKAGSIARPLDIGEARVKEPAGELLRARQVTAWLGVKYCALTSLENSRVLRPFRKSLQSHALYFKGELGEVFNVPTTSHEPKEMVLRRFFILDWLGISSKEFQSWVKDGNANITPLQLRPPKGKNYYCKHEIKKYLDAHRPRRRSSGEGRRKTERARAARWPK